MKRLGDWKKFRLLIKSTRHSNMEPARCAICQQSIISGHSYRDAGATGRAHESCVRAEKESR